MSDGMKLRILLVVSIAVGAAIARPAQAGSDLDAAKAAFDAAQIEYAKGNFDVAADGFKKAYEARNIPQFLYNIGAAYHMKAKGAADAATFDLAVDYYKRYLDADPKAS